MIIFCSSLANVATLTTFNAPALNPSLMARRLVQRHGLTRATLIPYGPAGGMSQGVDIFHLKAPIAR